MKEAAERRSRNPWKFSHDEYRLALKAYFEGAGEQALQHAYEIGRAALAAEVSLIELTRVHHASLAEVLLVETSPKERRRKLEAATDFFTEALSPYEMAYRGFREASLALRHFNNLLEEEAKRISHALHDEAGQLLVAVYIALEELSWSHPRAKKKIGKVKDLLDKIEEQMRRLSHELRPAILDDLGLVPALRYLSEGISQRTGLLVSIEAPQQSRCDSIVEAVIYRVVQEALNNITKHAGASHAWIILELETMAARCSIRDDGNGFDVEAVQNLQGERGFGLMGIHERARAVGGSVQVSSVRGQGTEIVVTVPLEA